jgi:hypothetical protein
MHSRRVASVVASEYHRHNKGNLSKILRSTMCYYPRSTRRIVRRFVSLDDAIIYIIKSGQKEIHNHDEKGWKLLYATSGRTAPPIGWCP